MEARGIDASKRYKCVLRRAGESKDAWVQTGVAGGDGALVKWNKTVELRHAIEARRALTPRAFMMYVRMPASHANWLSLIQNATLTL